MDLYRFCMTIPEEINDLDYGFRDVQIVMPEKTEQAQEQAQEITLSHALIRHKLSSSYLPEGQEELNRRSG